MSRRAFERADGEQEGGRPGGGRKGERADGAAGGRVNGQAVGRAGGRPVWWAARGAGKPSTIVPIAQGLFSKAGSEALVLTVRAVTERRNGTRSKRHNAGQLSARCGGR